MIFAAVFDSAVKAFATPMVFPTVAAATRVFMIEVNRPDPGNLLNTNRADFDLYHVGDFNPDTGAVTAVTPVVVIHGRDVAPLAVPASGPVEGSGG